MPIGIAIMLKRLRDLNVISGVRMWLLSLNTKDTNVAKTTYIKYKIVLCGIRSPKRFFMCLFHYGVD